MSGHSEQGVMGSMAAVMGLVLLRICLESAVYVSPPYNLCTLIHITLFYIAMLLAIATVVSLCSKTCASGVLKLLMLAFPAVLFPPLCDAIVYGVQARAISYVTVDGNVILHFLQCVFARGASEQISIGQFLLVHATAAVLASYTCWVARSLLRGVACYFVVLAVIYGFAIGPYALHRLAEVTRAGAIALFGMEVAAGDAIKENRGILSEEAELTACVFVTYLIALMGYLFTRNRHAFLAIIRNLRMSRLAFYGSVVLLGGLLGTANLHTAAVLFGPVSNWLAGFLLLIAVTLAFSSAVWINDIHDLDIDRISNTSRPLASEVITITDARWIAAHLGLYAAISSLLVGSTVFAFVVLCMATSYVYSAPPWRLRRYWLGSYACIGLVGVFLLEIGYNFAAVTVLQVMAPPVSALCVMLGLSLVATIKDIKDEPGDRAAGVRSIMTLFPRRSALALTGMAVLAGSLLLTAAVLPFWQAIVWGSMFGLGAFGVIVVWGGTELILLPLYYVSCVVTAIVYLRSL